MRGIEEGSLPEVSQCFLRLLVSQQELGATQQKLCARAGCEGDFEFSDGPVQSVLNGR